MQNLIKRVTQSLIKRSMIMLNEEFSRQRRQIDDAFRGLEKEKKQLESAYTDLEKTAKALDSDAAELPEEINSFINQLIENNFSMTSRLNLSNTALACINAVENKINGDFVECGVWRGGHGILASFVFSLYNSDKKVYLYDTFEGMTPPSNNDIRIFDDLPATKLFEIDADSLCNCSLEQVKKNFEIMKAPQKNVEFIKGDVRLTLEREINLPKKISVLRLDTDLYDSTKIELQKLYGLVEDQGVIIFDDYGYWAGQKTACDEFFEESDVKPYLVRIGGGTRLMIKKMKAIS